MATDLDFRPPPPHPQFHDRTCFADRPFSAEAAAWADRFRDMARNEDRIWCADLWPATRPARALIAQAAFRTPLRSPHKMVLLALVACVDSSGVAAFHVRRMAHFCGVKTAELLEALDLLASKEAGAAVTWWSEPGDWAQEAVVLLRRPESWHWTKSFPLPPYEGFPLHAVQGNPPRPGEPMREAINTMIAAAAESKRAI